MKPQLNSIGALLERNGLGNSIVVFLIAFAITTGVYGIYVSIITAIHAFMLDDLAIAFRYSPATAQVAFDFVAIALVWRYLSFLRVLRFFVRDLAEVSLLYHAAWQRGERVLALAPILILIAAPGLALALVVGLDNNRHPTHSASVHTWEEPVVRPMVSYTEAPCASDNQLPRPASTIDTDLN